MRRFVGRAPDTASWQYLATVLGVVTVLLGAAAALLRTLGLFVHRGREDLIGSPPLHYPEHELLLAGLGAVWELPWRAISALTSSHGGLRGAAWGLLLLSVAIGLGAGRLRRWRRGGEPLLLAVASLLTVVLFAGTTFTTIAVRAQNLANTEGRSLAPCTNFVSRNWADMVAFESCSWLVNDTAANAERRQSLGGLPAWLLAAVAVTGLSLRGADRRGRGEDRKIGRRWRRALLVSLALLGLLVLQLWPSAHAYATWGLAYPPAALGGGGECEGLAEERDAVAAGRCCAYDVTEAGDETTLLLVGRECPELLEGTLRVEDACIRSLPGDPQVVVQGCR